MDTKERLKKDLKILHVIDSEGIYGAEMVLLNLMEEQKKLGLEPWLCSIGSKTVFEKDLEREARKKALKVKTFRFANGPNIFGAYQILAFAQHAKFDIIHSHGYKSNILLGFIPRAIRKIPLIATIHGWTNIKTLSKMKIYEWLDLKSFKHVDAVIAVSQAMLSNPKFAGMNILVVNNGILSQETESLPISADNPVITFCESGFIIGSIGRLSEEKDTGTSLAHLSCC
jgi:glycosyltransferase involved in cell wall biosynthesis